MPEIYLDDIPGSNILESDINSQNGKEGCAFSEEIKYIMYEDEEFISLDIEDASALPLGLVYGGFFVTGTPIPLDTYHEVKDYLISYLSSQPDDYVPFPDVSECKPPPKLPLLTVGVLKDNPDSGHYSGKDWSIKGHKAYSKDGNIVSFEFTMVLTYLNLLTSSEEEYKRNFIVYVVPNIDPKVFIHLYGDSNENLVNDDREIVSPEEYITWRESQGHVFKRDCY